MLYFIILYVIDLMISYIVVYEVGTLSYYWGEVCFAYFETTMFTLMALTTTYYVTFQIERDEHKHGKMFYALGRTGRTFDSPSFCYHIVFCFLRPPPPYKLCEPRHDPNRGRTQTQRQMIAKRGDCRNHIVPLPRM